MKKEEEGRRKGDRKEGNGLSQSKGIAERNIYGEKEGNGETKCRQESE